jgi:hypothetical protein
MNKELNTKVFLFIGQTEFRLIVINSKKEKLFYNKILIDNLSDSYYFEKLNKFVKENIFKIEKKLKQFVNNIFLITNRKDLLISELSIKKKSIIGESKKKIINDLLILAKNQFEETLKDEKIIHFKINKFIFDDTEYLFLPSELDYSNLSIEVQFVCINKILIDKLKNIFNKYQIIIKKFYSYDYLLKQDNNKNLDFNDIVHNLMDNNLLNEVIIESLDRKKKRGFFEAFFNFFN